MKKVVAIYVLVFLVFSCGSVKNVAIVDPPITVKQFIEKPFGVEENVASLKERFAKDVKIKKMIRRNKHDAQKVDTIIQFYHRKSEVFVYKTYFNREMLIGGVIYDNRFPLVNGITPGITRENFYKAFIDLKQEIKDSVVIESKEKLQKFNFVFDSKGKLKKISFSLYVD